MNFTLEFNLENMWDKTHTDTLIKSDSRREYNFVLETLMEMFYLQTDLIEAARFPWIPKNIHHLYYRQGWEFKISHNSEWTGSFLLVVMSNLSEWQHRVYLKMNFSFKLFLIMLISRPENFRMYSILLAEGVIKITYCLKNVFLSIF